MGPDIDCESGSLTAVTGCGQAVASAVEGVGGSASNLGQGPASLAGRSRNEKMRIEENDIRCLRLSD